MENTKNNLPKTSTPAQRALERVGIAALEQLSQFSETEIAQLHGMGPKALDILREALTANGLAFTSNPKKNG